MKISYIANARIPTEKAHGYQICKMCEEFALLGHEVELLIPNRQNTIPDDAFAYYGLKRNFQIKRVKIIDFFKWEKRLMGLAVWFNAAGFALSLVFKKLDKGSVVYTRDPELAWLFSVRGFKTIFEAHTWPNSKTGLFKFFIQRAHRVVAISQGLKNELIKQGIDENKIIVGPDGVDLKKFDFEMSREEARQRLGLAEKRKIVMYTGHLYGWKGAQTLADAAEGLPDDAVVYFVGGTKTDQAKFKDKNKALVKNGRIVLIPHQPRDKVPFWLKAADVLVLPNSGKERISRDYTSPLKLFEYLASGRPIVASNLPAVREILNGGNSCLFQPDSTNDLKEKITECLKSGNEQMVFKSREDSKKYSWAARASKIITTIKDI